MKAVVGIYLVLLAVTGLCAVLFEPDTNVFNSTAVVERPVDEAMVRRIAREEAPSIVERVERVEVQVGGLEETAERIAVLEARVEEVDARAASVEKRADTVAGQVFGVAAIANQAREDAKQARADVVDATEGLVRHGEFKGLRRIVAAVLIAACVGGLFVVVWCLRQTRRVARTTASEKRRG